LECFVSITKFPTGALRLAMVLKTILKQRSKPSAWINNLIQ